MGPVSEPTDAELIALTDYQGDNVDADGQVLEVCAADSVGEPGDGGVGGQGQIGDNESYEIPDVDFDESEG